MNTELDELKTKELNRYKIDRVKFKDVKDFEKIIGRIRSKYYNARAEDKEPELTEIETKLITSRLEKLIRENPGLKTTWNIKIHGLLQGFKNEPDSIDVPNIYFNLLAEIKRGADHSWIAEEIQKLYINYLMGVSEQTNHVLWSTTKVAIAVGLIDQTIILRDGVDMYEKEFSLDELPLFSQIQEQIHTKQFKKSLKHIETIDREIAEMHKKDS